MASSIVRRRGSTVSATQRLEWRMTRLLRILLVMLAVCAMPALARPPTVTLDQLAKPPTDAQRYAILSSAGTHGSVATWTLPDGTLMERDSLSLRGNVTEV
jgi:hypothetical protein